MVLFFAQDDKVYAVDSCVEFDQSAIEKLEWLFSGAKLVENDRIEGKFVGPRREMITPWSTNAVEITQNMGLEGIRRIEEFFADGDSTPFDPMLNRRYDALDQSIYVINKEPEKIVYIDDIESYNRAEGLALSEEEIAYLNGWISKEELLEVYEVLKKNQYGQYLKDVMDGKYIDVLH